MASSYRTQRLVVIWVPSGFVVVPSAPSVPSVPSYLPHRKRALDVDKLSPHPPHGASCLLPHQPSHQDSSVRPPVHSVRHYRDVCISH